MQRTFQIHSRSKEHFKYLKIPFSALKWVYNEQHMNWETLFTVNAISSLVMVTYSRAPTIILYFWGLIWLSYLEERDKLLTLENWQCISLIIVALLRRYKIYFFYDKWRPFDVLNFNAKEGMQIFYIFKGECGFKWLLNFFSRAPMIRICQDILK